MYTSFEDLLVWQKAFDLADDIIPFIQDHFPTYSKLGDQLLASAVSVPSNIAEGSERGTNLDFGRFIKIAKGSNAELRTQLMLSKRYLQNKKDQELGDFITRSREIGRMLHGLHKSLKIKTEN